MKNQLYVVAPYISELSLDFTNRFLYLCKLCSSKNINVMLITSEFCHTSKSFHNLSSSMPFEVTLISSGSYKNANFSRFTHNLKFGYGLFKFFLSIKKNNSHVVVAYPFISSLIALFCFKNDFQKIIIDVQDLWPESFKLLFPSINPKIINLLCSPFFLLNKLLFKKFDHFCFVSNTFKDYFFERYINECDSHVCYIGNSKSNISYETFPCPKYPKKICNLVYIGSLEKSYDLIPFFDSILYLNSSKDIIYNLDVYGEGGNLLFYKNYCETNDIYNVTFHGYTPISELLPKLSVSHIAINPIIIESEASIINKHADYAFAALPVINTQKSNEYRNLLKDYGAGINVSFEIADIINAIKTIIYSEKSFMNYSRGSRNMYHLFDRDKTYLKYYEFIFKKNF